jgi:hypothetical protein
METAAPHHSLFHKDCVGAISVIVGSENFHLRAHFRYARRSNEDAGNHHGIAQLDRGFERCRLTPVTVPAYGDVEARERPLIRTAIENLFCEQNESRTRSEGRQSLAQTVRHILSKSAHFQQARDGGRFSTWNNQSVKVH